MYMSAYASCLVICRALSAHYIFYNISALYQLLQRYVSDNNFCSGNRTEMWGLSQMVCIYIPKYDISSPLVSLSNLSNMKPIEFRKHSGHLPRSIRSKDKT